MSSSKTKYVMNLFLKGEGVGARGRHIPTLAKEGTFALS